MCNSSLFLHFDFFVNMLYHVYIGKEEHLMKYDHIQNGYLHLILIASAVFTAALAFVSAPETIPFLLILALFLALVSFCFKTLRVKDEGSRLSVSFGPIPFFKRYIDYSEISGLEKSRSSIIDGWGIHYTPGRGWIWNLWGRNCICISMGDRRLRIGTDDPESLIKFLDKKIHSH